MADANDFNADFQPRAVTRLRAVPRVLIVEDCPETRYVYKRYLNRSGTEYHVIEAETVEDGLGILGSEPVDCVLLDYRLPDADGLDLLTDLCDGNGSRVPVVMITGHGDESIAVDAMKLGAKDYLVKDRMNAESLVAAVEYALKKAQAEDREHQYRRKLEHESVTDPLTGLHNRRHLFERLDVELRRSMRYQVPLCFLLIDLDHFKAVNDNRGHVTGDRVLQSFAEMLTGIARSSDLVVRYGGEEFCVVLTNTDLQGGEHFAERVRAEARRMTHRDEHGECFSVTCSVGLVQSYPGDVSAEALIRRSDRALYDAKHNGRDQVCVYAERGPATASA